MSLSFILSSLGGKLETISIAVLLGKAFPVNKHYLTWALGERFCPAWLSHSDRRNNSHPENSEEQLLSLVPLQILPPSPDPDSTEHAVAGERLKGGNLPLSRLPNTLPHKACSRVSTHEEMALRRQPSPASLGWVRTLQTWTSKTDLV